MDIDAKYHNGPTDYVRLWKIAAVENPDHRSGDPDTYPLGAFGQTDESLPVGYHLEGWLLKKPVVGGRVEVLRLARNGVPALGYFTSSIVVELEESGFRTRNSLYSLTTIPQVHPQPPGR